MVRLVLITNVVPPAFPVGPPRALAWRLPALEWLWSLRLPVCSSTRCADLRVWLRTVPKIPQSQVSFCGQIGDSWVVLISGSIQIPENNENMISCLYLPKQNNSPTPQFLFHRQGSPGRDKHYLYPACSVELGRLCPSWSLWAGGVHILHDPHCQPWCVPHHRVSGFLSPVDVYEEVHLLWIWLGCFSKFSGCLALCYL